MQNASGLDVTIEDISEQVAALALQGPTSAKLLRKAAQANIDRLRYFRVTTGTIAGVTVDISRTGYTGDLGYEVWAPWGDAVKVWDALVEAGKAFDLRPAGMLALDVARIEAGLLLIDVDFRSSKKAIIDAQAYSPYEMGLGRLVALDKPKFVGQKALLEEHRKGHTREIVGIDIDWNELEAIHERYGLTPTVPAAASRVAVPVYVGSRQTGKATSTTWSPTLKKYIALAEVKREHTPVGTRVEIEMTVEAVRHRVGAQVVPIPFFNPKRKTATPPA
jgi:aminomethyltransferase